MLIYPPITDPTAPLHSLVYVASHARANGFSQVEVRDTNVEALNYLAQPVVLDESLGRWARRRHELAARPALSRFDQLEFEQLTQAAALRSLDVSEAIAILRDPEAFYDYRTYCHAVRKMQCWSRALSCDAWPGQFTGWFDLAAPTLFSFGRLADLTSKAVLNRVVGSFGEYYKRKLFPELRQGGYRVVGISIAYDKQLPFALWLLREIRTLLPGCYLVCGGTAVTHAWKILRERRLAGLFESADACVVSDGETAFLEILRELQAGRVPVGLPNTIPLSGDVRQDSFQPTLFYEDLDKHPAPDYSLLRHDLYFSPHACVPYSPTRGCYWNKCTFCDIGLHFGTPASPWRQRSLDLVVEDLRLVSRTASFVYLAVDVMAPAGVFKLAKAIIGAGIELKWATQMRPERGFNAELCRALKASGCVSVSLGLESGCQRVLDRINKGVRTGEVEPTLRAFSVAGIPLQIMAITGFPGETAEEAKESIAFLQKNRRQWTTVVFTSFLLTSGAIVAQHPSAFGLSNVRLRPREEITGILNYDETGPGITESRVAQIQQAMAGLARCDFSRPYAGGLDCAHSIFYYARYGRRFPPAIRAQARRKAAAGARRLPLVRNGVLLDAESYELVFLFGCEQLGRLFESAEGERVSSLNATQLIDWLHTQEATMRRAPKVGDYFVRGDGRIIPCSRELAAILAAADGRRRANELKDTVLVAFPDKAGLVERLLNHAVKWELLLPATT
jgi:hypothetical protein